VEPVRNLQIAAQRSFRAREHRGLTVSLPQSSTVYRALCAPCVTGTFPATTVMAVT
jgi:hypothetical protein